MLFSALNLKNAVGAAGFLLSLLAYCVVRRIMAGGQTPARLYCNARVCIMVGLLKMSIGIFEIVYFNDSGGTWWGMPLVLFSLFWLVRGSKFRRQAATVSAGYQAFNQQHQQQPADYQREHRLSNAPQIVIVSDPAPQAQTALAKPSRSGHAGLSRPAMSNFDAPLIRNAVPPSPFTCTQGTEPYIVPSINMAPMAHVLTPTTPRSDIVMITPRTHQTIGNVATANDGDLDDTQQHAEDSIYIEEEEEDEDGDDGKVSEVEHETPSGPAERKTSEGNVTFS